MDISVLALALLGGALKSSTPFLLVGLGECLTERSGRVNIGLEGTLIFGAMAAYATSYGTGSPWLGVFASACAGLVLGCGHGLICSLKNVSHIAVGIAFMVFGTGLAFLLGKPLIEPQAPYLSAIELGSWSTQPIVRSALELDPLLALGIVIAVAMTYTLNRTRKGLLVRAAGDDAKAVEALGFSVNSIRTICTALGGAIAGLGGASLALFYPGGWHESLAKGQGLMAIALVIFARWSPMGCIYAALLFGASGALGPSLQAMGYASGFQPFNACPYILTLAILIVRSSAERSMAGAPLELTVLK